ncbi:hypothetical protein D3C73_1522930 [compost metagenome]
MDGAGAGGAAVFRRKCLKLLEGCAAENPRQSGRAQLPRDSAAAGGRCNICSGVQPVQHFGPESAEHQSGLVERRAYFWNR